MSKVAVLALATALVAAVLAWQMRDRSSTEPEKHAVTKLADSANESEISLSAESPMPVSAQPKMNSIGLVGTMAKVGTVAKANSVEEWIQALPVERRSAAERFVNSYGNAYIITSEAEQQWLIAHGYPSLEEVVSFERSAMSTCPPQSCTNAKVSALSAALLTNDMEQILADVYGKDGLPEDYLGQLPTEQKRAFLASLTEARGYTSRARDNGSQMFAAYLRARLARLIGDDAEANAAESFLSACGDPRVSISNTIAAETALGLLDSLPGGTLVCGYGPGRPTFPN